VPDLVPTKLITPPEAAEICGVAVNTLCDWRLHRVGPPYIRLGHRTVRYPLEELMVWIAQNRVAS
jgi:predicted DNA-binding transcriptional regulator AlpA